MTPDDLLRHARELVEGPDEVYWRNAVGRAYFAAFHAARDLLRACGFDVPRDETAHRYLAERLRHCGLTHLEQAARELAGLRRDRNRADYDVDSPFPAHVADDAVELAAGLVAAFTEAARDAGVRAAITPPMAEYECAILGVTTLRPAP